MSKTDLKDLIPEWQQVLAGSGPEDVLNWALKQFGSDRLMQSSSLGMEDMVITDLLREISSDAGIFTLDTGRFFQESYDLMEEIRIKWKTPIRVYFPEAKAVEELVSTKGPNSFYTSLENRRECCRIRKIDPLKRALDGLDAWICGLRRDQSVTRQAVEFVEWDEAFSLVKINPLAQWSEDQCRDYIKDHSVPIHILHKKGYPSIGCAPCTRAVREGEDIRSGRWWWENPESRECGLHKKK
ncbi:phosphoadenylyl-sulfate reductase [Oceanispirochaeta sp.]|jgi:phosphoadenosine phosphosulfate reductase|uniref:phosphoadenylyl-sulfate reductase n=1 Tax=Oceanispirochaeta sp. TaxID=2035350 RepID=UPI002610EA6A|nr:phosphoadenylyl-sulfate reductase [Oceanispirochaeta sp.]MDA3956698.1 phosphoadenylyl-sulfate reductase [Oceanispirochaeta sp.]